MRFDDPAGTVGAALAHTAAEHAGTAFIDQDATYTWPEMDRLATRIGQRLQALGIGHGDRIGVILPNQIEWVALYFAAARIGAVVVGLSVRYRDTELDFMLSDSGAKAVLAPASFAGFDYVGYLHAARARMPHLQHLMFVGAPQADGDGDVDFGEWMQDRAGETAAPSGVGPAPDDLVMVIYTSGTTGRPKAAGLTHRSQLTSASAQQAHTGMASTDLLQLALPLNHVGGITCGVLSMLIAGGASELVAAFQPDTVLAMTRRHPPTMLVGVPTMLTLLLMHPDFAQGNWSRVRLMIVGGSNVEPALLKRLQTAFPNATLMNLYGLSESSGAVVMTPRGATQDALLNSIGKPLRGASVRVLNPDGTDAAVGEVGELLFRGCGVIPRYVGAQQDEGTFDAEGWLHSGDMGYQDAAGQIYLMGRRKDMFLQGGFNVYPAEVEGVIGALPGVVMVAGIGVPDPVLGEIGRYYVVAKPDSGQTADAIVAHCREHLADYKVPRQVVFRDALPMTPAGKIQKAALRDEARPTPQAGEDDDETQRQL
ncbi:AMP-binding protein [Ottowia sp. GY511]|uniref:Class I adenylate-forming enzyme family protein n=1 Tax=Ottowia flava TaxID=2675430 RepID=A0ABW4KR14_9BURK|nr:AMP-binding protein [Ottowia sp. GY511]TXK33020.1 AMP-binding protein [Ottowia sp. GY511]